MSDHTGMELAERENSAENLATKTYKVVGLDCPSCAESCALAVEHLDFVKDAEINFSSGQLTVQYDPTKADEHDAVRGIVDAVRGTNHDVELSDKDKSLIDDNRSWFEINRERVYLVVSGLLIVIGFVMVLVGKSVPIFGRMSSGAFILAALLGVVAIGPSVITAFKLRKVDMNILMSTAVIGAILIGAYEEAAIVIFLDQVGEYLEGYSMRKTRGSVRKLMTLAPEEAHVIHGDHLHTVPVSQVEVGTLIKVKPGERIPLDGTIVEGQSAIDESPVTGESVPVDKGVGAEVFAGSLNTNAVLDIKVTADEGSSMLSRIVAMVEGAQAKKAPYEDFIDRFASKYTPIVVGIAALVAVVPPLITTLTSLDIGGWYRWIYTALTLLVISCPCALVISTPVSFVSGITKAARIGVLVKGGAYMELASKVDAVAFDKTGTLTIGKPQVIGLAAAEGVTEEQLLTAAAAIEATSNHPLAQAVVNYAKEHNVAIQPCEDMEEITASGVRGKVNGADVFVGKPSYIKTTFAQDMTAHLTTALNNFLDKGATALLVSADGKELGVIAVADTLRPEAKTAIKSLQDIGITKLEMLTGDNHAAASAIAQELGLTAVQAELLPEDKITCIEEMERDGHKVAMVGDGINDAPALASAHIGVTMGAAASDTALEVADVALMSADLRQLPAFLKLAQRTMTIVRENITLAIAVKVLFLILALFGKTTMWMAVFADTGITLIVILNGMRLLLGKHKLEGLVDQQMGEQAHSHAHNHTHNHTTAA